LTFNRLTAGSSSGITKATGLEANMADEPEDPDAAADRLEAALERIAQLTSVPATQAAAAAQDADLSVSEIAERLDALIGRLRAALGKPD
jgi:hypothetical protein